MRYSIMLQIVVVITVILLGSAALFAWIQNRNRPSESSHNLMNDPGLLS